MKRLLILLELLCAMTQATLLKKKVYLWSIIEKVFQRKYKF